MEWTDILIKIKSQDKEKAQAIGLMAIPRGLYIEDYSDFEEAIAAFGPIEIIDEELLNKDKDIVIIHLYVSPEENPNETISFLTDRFQEENITYTLEVASIEEEDWATSWKKYFKPIKIGKKLIIIPSWEANIESSRTKILLDPGMAFGSGQHETTRLCLELLDSKVKDGDRVLDVGTGTGILAIASLLLGAKEALGIDIDPLSIKVAKENSLLNEVRADFKLRTINQLDEASFDIVVANIVADVIIDILDDIKGKLKKGGLFIASGIIELREEDMRKTLASKGFRIQECKTENSWVSFLCVN